MKGIYMSTLMVLGGVADPIVGLSKDRVVACDPLHSHA